jgi:hypothetical protein
VNRALPDGVARHLVSRTMHRNAEQTPVFPARYDQCYTRALRRAFAVFDGVDITPLYRGAGYFGFSPRLVRLYLAYENVIARLNASNLASHYLVVARR